MPPENGGWNPVSAAPSTRMAVVSTGIRIKLPVTDKSPDYTGAHRNTHVSTRPVALFSAINTSERRSGQLRV